MERSTELADALRTVYEAVSDGDEATLTGSLSAREGMVFIGTDPDEWFDDSGAIQAMLKAQAAAGVKVQGGAIVAYEEGTVGWAADQGAFILPDGSEVPFRITVVFHREDGGWKIVQEHASVAVANEEAVGTSL
ncbi:MAG: nuclear transport factor 2 family protein [Microthrixaceae bacterium]